MTQSTEDSTLHLASHNVLAKTLDVPLRLTSAMPASVLGECQSSSATEAGSLRNQNQNDGSKTKGDDAGAGAITAMKHPLLPFMPYMERLRTENSPPHRILPKSFTIDLNTLKHWQMVCDKFHRNHCGLKRSYDESTRPELQWLIDVDQGCIVPAPAGARYLTLSYVWSKKRRNIQDCTTISNLEQLQIPGALLTPDVHISKTIGQAIRLTKDLRHQFLWVDRFCIIQDDWEHKQSHLDSMAAIYSNSYLTIVAAYGADEEDGLFGAEKSPPKASKWKELTSACKNAMSSIRPGPRKNTPTDKKTPRQPTWVANWPHRDVMQWYALHLLDSSWYSRAWTFQEQLFATRKLVFQNSTVNWECHCGCWQEGQGAFDPKDQTECAEPPSVGGSLLNPSPIPDMHRYARLIALYNRRTLTFPEDAIDAFAGILSDLSNVFPGGFIAGLPLVLFDACLLWQPYTEPQRRIPHKSQNAPLPSWSWVGWRTDVNSESLRSAYNYQRKNTEEFTRMVVPTWFPSSWVTVPTISWYHSTEVHGPRIEIERLFPPSTCIDAQSSTFELPSGWSRDLCSETGRYYYKHESAPDQELWFPIALSLTSKATVPVNRSRYLHCRTRIATLEMGSKFNHFNSSKCPAVDLIAADQRWVGVLRLNSREDWQHGVACELIELSQGSVRDQPTEERSFDEWHREQCPRKSGYYEFYNVMWITRDGDVAYRRAVGRVERSAWEQFALESIEITLG